MINNATDLIISQPGRYLLGDNITSTPSTPGDNIINITSSDVVLDFDGKFISQANATANISGIVINPNLNDIVIQNGVIRNVTGTGLTLTSTDLRVRLVNMVFENCTTAGMSATGTVGAITDLEIRQCRFLGCCSGASAGTNVLALQTCNRVMINDCIIANSLSTSNTSLSCIALTSCSMCDVINVTIQNNSVSGANSLTGIQESGTSLCNYSNITIRNPTASNTINGFLGSLGPINNSYSNCSIIGNQATALFQGFKITGTNNVFFRCKVIGNTVANTTAAATNACFFPESSQSIYLDCIGSTLSVQGGANASSFGFNANTGIDMIYSRCIASNNTSNSTGGIASGFITNTTNSTHAVIDCLFSSNVGITTSSGANDVLGQATSHNLYTRNVAFNNSTNQNNQFLNLAGGSRTLPGAPATANIAGVNGAWTNVGVAT
jgi:hypothetical protein